VRFEAGAVALDAVLIAGGYCVVMLVRTVGEASPTQWADVLHFLPLAVVATLAVAWRWGLYSQMWRYAGIAEARRVVLAGLTSAVLVTLVSLGVGRPFPMSVSLFGAMAVTLLIGGVRFQSRLFSTNRRRTDVHGLRVVVLGAGEAAAELVRNMRRDPRSGFVPVAMLDDDPRKVGRSCAGVQVLGPFETLTELARTTELHQVILAVPTASAAQVRRAADLADSCDLPLRVLPPVAELVGGRVRTTAIRDLRIDDLLGRAPVPTDLASVRGLLEGRRVLVTGAGGSIGSEIARQVADCAPAALLLLDHDETHLHDVLGTLSVPAVPLLTDIRHRDDVARVFRLHRPHVVFHAAAHKHVPLLEAHPCEAVKTNVQGTRNVLDAASAVSVERFVFVSTDKAVDPSSVMGATKRLGERMTLAAAGVDQRYAAVRFGNVLGSRGSVIPTFLRQIAAGGPVTVTDARMTRYFMSIPEAVHLVLQTAAMSEGGEIFMLEMGQPVRIIDLAARMVRLSGYRPGADIEIRVTGIRPGEKLEEELRQPSEQAMPTAHPAVCALRDTAVTSPLEPDDVERLVRTAVAGDHASTYRGVFRLVRGERLTTDVITLPHGRDTEIDLRQEVPWTSSTT
jgi:FlaA1/EpsC-like NDP-sugar epimerase